jgi:hypothetical protein
LNLPDELNIASPSAVVQIGDLAPGQQRQVVWLVSPYPLDTSRDTTVIYRVDATSANASPKSAERQVTMPALSPSSGECRASSGTWENNSIEAQVDTFVASFTASPSAANMDGVIGLSASPASQYADLAAIVRFNPEGFIDARNGSSYQAAYPIPYDAGASYQFRLVVRVPSHDYDIFVTPANSTEQVVGTNFAFRTEQGGVASLSNLALYAKSGSHQTCDIDIAPMPPNSANLGGTWIGSLAQGGAISFFVSSGDIVNDGYVELNNGSTCPGFIHDFGPATIGGNSFIDTWRGASVTITVSGTFSSSNSVSGRYIVFDRTPGSACSMDIAWSATKS